MVMAAKIFKRLSVKTPAELAQKTHQAFVRLPYESSPERLVEDLARLLAGLKVRPAPPRRPPSPRAPLTSPLPYCTLRTACLARTRSTVPRRTRW